MFETSSQTTVEAELCRCGNLPIKHGKFVLEGYSYHPIFSRNSALIIAQKEENADAIEEGDIDEIKAQLRQLDLPETHFLDLTAPHLVYTEEDDEGREEEGSISDSEEEDKANFQLCPFCSGHWSLFTRAGQPIASPRTKREAFSELDKAVSEGLIPLEDHNHVYEQIAESPLPNREFDSQEADDSLPGPSAFDEFDDLD